MTTVLTSHTHPLQIAEVKTHSSYGRIGITFCTGKHDRLAIASIWERNLHVDLDTIKVREDHTVKSGKTIPLLPCWSLPKCLSLNAQIWRISNA